MKVSEWKTHHREFRRRVASRPIELLLKGTTPLSSSIGLTYKNHHTTVYVPNQIKDI